MAFPHQIKFIISNEDLENSPSRKDGLSKEMEEQLRFYGCEIICEACVLLRLSQVVSASGQTYFHRFYALESFRRHDVKVRAAFLFS